MTSSTAMNTTATHVPYMAKKLQQRLVMLNDNPSKESLQTIARWCAFHRRPPKAQQICNAMLQSITTKSSSSALNSTAALKRGLLYVSALNEILMCDAPVNADSGTPPDSSDKIFSQLQLWENLASLRSLMGETVIVPVLEHLVKLMAASMKESNGSSVVEEGKESLLHMMDGWESVNAFDSPSLTEQLRKMVINVDATVKIGQIFPDAEAASPSVPPTATLDVISATAEVPAREDIPQAQQSRAMSSAPTDSINKAADTARESEDYKNNSTAVPMETENAKFVTNADAEETDKDVENVQVMDIEDHDVASEIKASQIEDGGEVVIVPSSNNKEPSTSSKDSSDDSSKGQQASGVKSPATAIAGVNRRASEGATTVFEKVDFEKEGIPYKAVRIDQIVKPCQAIATTQVARDLRHDFIIRLATVLDSLPAAVVEYAQKEEEKEKNKGSESKDDAEKKEEEENKEEEEEREDGLTGDGPPLGDYPDDFLELNLKDALNKVEQYRNAVQKQKDARSTCVNLLLSSHCQFGSREAASSFDDVLSKLEALKETKTALRDAMELEGIDMEDDDEINIHAEEKIEPLPWHNKKQEGSENESANTDGDTPAKRRKVD